MATVGKTKKPHSVEKEEFLPLTYLLGASVWGKLKISAWPITHSMAIYPGIDPFNQFTPRGPSAGRVSHAHSVFISGEEDTRNGTE